ncbi:hypothetical protein F383_02671 [Gossypium arboreum]|uniref:Uncharacterized protein n=1 Tax=Gossypium arboreum TaxID=29729 RepID=A0A0B0P0E9_GOSAR|nr:hypothetical protein F383_02671 [Gossypium arboreum]
MLKSSQKWSFSNWTQLGFGRDTPACILPVRVVLRFCQIDTAVWYARGSPGRVDFVTPKVRQIGVTEDMT